MWTPRRVAVLVAGFVVFLSGYVVYGRFLGGIDGLPPLPPDYLPGLPHVPTEPRVPRLTKVDEMLQTAFGAGSAELNYSIRVGNSSRGVFLAAEDFGFEKDGRFRLEPVSLALFSKPAPGKHPEINRLRARVAYLTFDRPVTGPQDISNRRIVAAELTGNIDIVHNRRTPQQDDDIAIYIPNGPVYFDDARRLIQTNDAVKLEDTQTKPHPTTVTGEGLEVHLAANAAAAPGQKAAPKPKPDKDGGVELIVLRSNVEMHLYLDSRSGFPTPGRQGPAARENEAQPAAAARDHVYIRTDGPFRYDLIRNHAQFDVPEKRGLDSSKRIEVARNPLSLKEDRLECRHLELQLRRKDRDAARPPATPANDDRTADLEIETAHAVGDVVLHSNPEMLDAGGSDLFYDARARLSTLKGEPEMWLMKEGNMIYARELEMVDQKGVQVVTSRGAGRIHLFDKKTGTRVMHARWKEKFVSSADGKYELLSLSGDAAFVEDPGLDATSKDALTDEKLLASKTLKNFLRADNLQVWLEPKPRTAAPSGQPAEGGGRKPHQVEASGHVLVRSPEMHVHDTERLIVLFREPPAAPAALTAPAARNPPAATPTTVAPPRPEPPAKTPRPVDLTARYVKAYVLRGAARNELDEVHCEGVVRVFQAPSGPDDKGVDIRGATLDLKRKPGGNELTVTGIDHDRGSDHELAQVRMDKLFIIGPKVVIDQAANTAVVHGNGAMVMETAQDFQGNKLTRPVPLEIHWATRMDFDGDFVEFQGDVEAKQGESRLGCDALQVYLDRAISLKEGNKGGQPVRAKKLTCNLNVRVEERALHPQTGALLSFRYLECTELTVTNGPDEQSHMHVSGAGTLRIVQPGGDVVIPPAGGGAKPAPDEWKLTLVSYTDKMIANSKDRTAKFWGHGGHVKVLHIPWNKNHDPAAAIAVDRILDKLPPGGLYLSCDHLSVYSPQDRSRDGQVLDSEGRVYVQSTDAKEQSLSGTAEKVHYDEKKDQVIFDGGEGGKARLSVVEAKGREPRVVTGEKIQYLRKKGEFLGTGLSEIRGSN